MEKINEDLQHPSRSHQTAKSQVHTSGLQPFQSLLGHISAQQALARDGFRCMASGVFDLHLVNPQTVEVPRLSLALTQCCHIFPESLYDFKGVVDRNRKVL